MGLLLALLKAFSMGLVPQIAAGLDAPPKSAGSGQQRW
jgi:hypothetical protein